MIITIALSINPTSLFSQTDMTITIVDGDTGEPIIGVTIYTDDYSFTATSDFDGTCVLSDLAYRDEINFSYLGYRDLKLPFYQIRKLGAKVKMYVDNVLLDSIVVIGRPDDPISEIPYVVQKIGKEEIAFLNGQTAVDAINNDGGVYIQKSQMGGGSPVIRGFEANRVLLVLDGVRMNNAIYRNGHLQNAITVDNAMLEQVEVIYGPGSLVYGSDALGGVVHFRSREPKLLFGDANISSDNYNLLTNAYTRFSSANMEKSLHVDVDYGTKKWGSISSATYSNYGDLRAGDNRPEEYPDFGKRRYYVQRIDGEDVTLENSDPNIQVGTAYSQFDLMQKIKFQPKDHLSFVFNTQYSTSTNVPRYDILVDTLENAAKLKWAEWNYGPQKRLLTSLKIKSLKPTAIYDKATFIAAYQRIDEDRLQRKVAKLYRSFSKVDVHVASLTADFKKAFDDAERHNLSYGLEGNYNLVYSKAGRINIKNEKIINDEVSRYPSGGSTMSTYAGYVYYRGKNSNSTLNFNAGLRFSNVNLLSQFEADDPVITWPDSYIDPGISTNNTAITWGTGLTWNPKNRLQVRMLVSTAFRSPNIDDFSKIRAKNYFVTAPNKDLQPEHATNGELTIAKEFGAKINSSGHSEGRSVKISATGFYTYLKDAIVRQIGSLTNGDTLLVVEGEPHRVQQNVNALNGKVFGLSGNFLYNINSVWQIKSSINYTRGRSILVDDTEKPLSHIPPVYGQFKLAYNKNKLRIEGIVRFNGKKAWEDYALNDADNEEHAIEGVGSLAWQTFNLYASYQFAKRMSINFDIENIMDLHYRPFASGISAPGRNFIFALRGEF